MQNAFRENPNASADWRNEFWRIIRPVLFRLDAEFVHEMSIHAIRLFNSLGGGANRLLSGRYRTSLPETSRLPQVFGKPLLSRVGLAAGFDKNGLILEALPDLGFGFAEVGTVTPRPQLGNERPRLFRDSSRGGLFNRMGFNNDGAEKIAARVAEARERIPSSFRVGINIGKNRDTPVERAIEDYVLAARPFSDLADFIVVNVSSPNTPGLRSLQSSEFLRPLLNALRDETGAWVRAPRLLLKLAPELLHADHFEELIQEAPNWGCEGWVLANTLAGTRGDQAGGWSGIPVQMAAREILLKVRSLSSLPIVSVGGIMDRQEAIERISAGADLVEVYSGWIYGGPGMPWDIAKAIGAISN